MVFYAINGGKLTNRNVVVAGICTVAASIYYIADFADLPIKQMVPLGFFLTAFVFLYDQWLWKILKIGVHHVLDGKWICKVYPAPIPNRKVSEPSALFETEIKQTWSTMNFITKSADRKGYSKSITFNMENDYLKIFQVYQSDHSLAGGSHIGFNELTFHAEDMVLLGGYSHKGVATDEHGIKANSGYVVMLKMNIRESKHGAEARLLDYINRIELPFGVDQAAR